MKLPAVPRPRFTPQRSRRVRALLACGILLGTGAFGTAAFWSTSAATVSGQFTTAHLEIRAEGQEHYTFTFPGTLLPGDTTAVLLNVQNTGSVPFGYDGKVSSGSTLGTAMTLTARAGGSVSGAACTGGTVLTTGQAITGTASSFFPAARGPLAAGTGTDPLCLQLTLPTGAPGVLAGTSGTVTFTFDATSTS